MCGTVCFTWLKSYVFSASLENKGNLIKFQVCPYSFNRFLMSRIGMSGNASIPSFSIRHPSTEMTFAFRHHDQIRSDREMGRKNACQGIVRVAPRMDLKNGSLFRSVVFVKPPEYPDFLLVFHSEQPVLVFLVKVKSLSSHSH